MPNIKLQSSDGEVFEVDVDIAKCSVTIKTMLEDLGMDEDEEEVVPLPNVNSAILRKVIQWATYHKDDPPPPEDDENKEKRTDDISSWDADFLKVNFENYKEIDLDQKDAKKALCLVLFKKLYTDSNFVLKGCTTYC